MEPCDLAPGVLTESCRPLCAANLLPDSTRAHGRVRDSRLDPWSPKHPSVLPCETILRKEYELS